MVSGFLDNSRDGEVETKRTSRMKRRGAGSGHLGGIVHPATYKLGKFSCCLASAFTYQQNGIMYVCVSSVVLGSFSEDQNEGGDINVSANYY